MFCSCSIDLMCVYVSCLPVTCPTQVVTSHSACWPLSQTRGQAIMTSTTLLPCRRWYMPPRSGCTWVDNTTPEQPGWTSDTDTMPSMRSPSVAGEELHIYIQRSTISSDSEVVGGVWVAVMINDFIWICICGMSWRTWNTCTLRHRHLNCHNSNIAKYSFLYLEMQVCFYVTFINWYSGIIWYNNEFKCLHICLSVYNFTN